MPNSLIMLCFLIAMICALGKKLLIISHQSKTNSTYPWLRGRKDFFFKNHVINKVFLLRFVMIIDNFDSQGSPFSVAQDNRGWNIFVKVFSGMFGVRIALNEDRSQKNLKKKISKIMNLIWATICVPICNGSIDLKIRND